MGLVLNRPLQRPKFDDLLRQLEVAPVPPARRIRLCAGGPMDNARGFVLHTTDWTGEGSLRVNDAVALTASLDVLKAIAEGDGPREGTAGAGLCRLGAGPARRRDPAERLALGAGRRDHRVRRRPRHEVAPRARQAEHRSAAAVGRRRARVALSGCTPLRRARRTTRNTGGSSDTGRAASASVRPSSNCGSYASSVQASTAGVAASLRFTTMRAEAHITSSGDLCRMPQQAVVISGTSRCGVHLREQHQPHRIVRVDRQCRVRRTAVRSRRAARASGSPEKRRPATSMANPLRASQTRPSIVGAQLRRPRSASCTAGV